jgi:hypothetical protein
VPGRSKKRKGTRENSKEGRKNVFGSFFKQKDRKDYKENLGDLCGLLVPLFLVS